MNFLKKNYTWINSTLITFLFFLFFMISHKIIPFGNVSLVTHDCYQQVYPFTTVLYDKLKSGDSLNYYWNSGLGGNFLATYFYYLVSPVNLLVVLVDRTDILGFITFTIIIKLSISAGTFGFFLSRQNEEFENNVLLIPFSCAYALCNFMLAYYHESMWLDSFVLFPIIMYGYKKLMKEHKPAIYILSLAVAAFLNFYIVYIMGLFLCLWFIIDDHVSFKGFIADGIRFGLASILAAGMSALSLLVSYLGVNLTHVGGETLVSHEWYGNIFEVLREHFIFTKLQSIGEKLNYSNIYSGTFVIVLVFAYIFIKDIKLSERLRKIALAVFMLISMDESVLNFIWHAFHKPLFIPNRFGFLYVFVLLVMAWDAYCHLDKSGIKLISVGFVLAELFPMVSYFFVDFDSRIKSSQILVISLVLVLIYSIIFFVMTVSDKKRVIFCIFTSLIMIVELFINAGYLLDREVVLFSDSVEGMIEDFEFFQEAVATNNANDKECIYRSSLVYEDMMNGNSLCNLNGIDVFTSIFPFDTYRFTKLNGIYSRDNGIRGYGYPEVLEDIFAEKYAYVYKTKDCYADRVNYNPILSTNQINIYENTDALSLGFGVNNSIRDYELYSEDSFANINQLTEKMAGVVPVFEEIAPECQVSSEGLQLSAVESDHICIKSVIEDYKNRKLSIVFPVEFPGEYYVELSTELDNIIDFYKNDDKIRSLSACPNLDMFYMGRFETGDVAKIEFSNLSDEDYKLLSEELVELRFAILNEEMYHDFLDDVSKNQMSVEIKSSDRLIASINLDEGQTLFTSIPYDEGWHVYENGKEIDKIKLTEAFIGLELGSGQHELEFKYIPQGLYIGAGVSLVSCMIFIVLIIILKKQKNIVSEEYEEQSAENNN